jgi:hypothetical protein
VRAHAFVVMNLIILGYAMRAPAKWHTTRLYKHFLYI